MSEKLASPSMATSVCLLAAWEETSSSKYSSVKSKPASLSVAFFVSEVAIGAASNKFSIIGAAVSSSVPVGQT